MSDFVVPEFDIHSRDFGKIRNRPCWLKIDRIGVRRAQQFSPRLRVF
jgi:hypothetical protein